MADIQFLSRYFRQPELGRALHAYAVNIGDAGWPVKDKFALYSLSAKVGNPALCDDDRFRSFEQIYKTLSSGAWRAMRSRTKKKDLVRFTAREAYNALNQYVSAFSLPSGRDLLNLSINDHSALVSAILPLKGIKRNKHYPIMAVSKFLHFYNPRLFPIWDNAVVDKKVFVRFWDDHVNFCSANNLRASANGAEFLANYVCWASELVLGAGPDYMSLFLDWLEDEMPPRIFRNIDTDATEKLYAVAFEITAIGATFLPPS